MHLARNSRRPTALGRAAVIVNDPPAFRKLAAHQGKQPFGILAIGGHQVKLAPHECRIWPSITIFRSLNDSVPIALPGAW